MPSEPLVAAALERVNEAGENPLYDFLLPTAILRLKQELGRLPRPARTAGMALWILDPRLCTEKYARAFLRGLGREAVVCATEEELMARTSRLGPVHRRYRGPDPAPAGSWPRTRGMRPRPPPPRKRRAAPGAAA